MVITTDGFGLMLAVGDLAWVLLLYLFGRSSLSCFQARWAGASLDRGHCRRQSHRVFRGSNDEKLARRIISVTARTLSVSSPRMCSRHTNNVS